MVKKHITWFVIALVMFLQINSCIYIFAEQNPDTNVDGGVEVIDEAQDVEAEEVASTQEGVEKENKNEDNEEQSNEEDITKEDEEKEENPNEESAAEESEKVEGAIEEVVEEGNTEETKEEIIEEENKEERKEDTTEEEKIEEDIEENDESTYIEVTDLDIAEYRSSMEEGEKQLLMVTVLPLDATNQKIKYYSSEESVARINQIGRITAVDSGTTKITIEAADGVSRQFKLKVNSPKSTNISVSEIDLGDYQEEMRIGDKKLLSVTVLPYDATDRTIRYTSSDEEVASINGLGRITALSVGETVITARAGSKKSYFVLNVLPKKDTSVKGIDLGDYIKRMKVGDTQMLMPAVLPPDAENPGFKYLSKNTDVATINGLGRIRTHKVGTSEIIVEADEVKKKFTLTVYEEKEIKVTNMDLGDYQRTMEVGDKQLLSPSVYPMEASDRKITYKSTNEEIATVNIFGRVYAKSVGDTKIIVSVDGIEKSFDLKVEESKNYPVEGIDIGKYDEKMEVGKTQKLQVTVLPYNATDAKVEYISDGHKILTVDTAGEVKAIKEGKAVIKVSAGDITKEITISVVTATEKIEINKTYVVLKTNEQFQLECRVLPKEANGKIEYKSIDTSIAKVDGNGLITAVDTGASTVIVTNGYMQSEVTVLVNKELIKEVDEAVLAANFNLDSDVLTEVIKKSDHIKTVIDKNEFKKVTKSALKYLLDAKKILIVDGSDYIITINGRDIVNFENELLTNIDYIETADGTEVVVNEKGNLPGKISISFEDETIQRGKHLYLYNEAKKKYEVINNAIELGTINVDIGGKYLIAEKEISFFRINLLLIIIGAICFIAIIVVYIFTKKKYWFW
jgi:uncharacterized protein YjdB